MLEIVPTWRFADIGVRIREVLKCIYITTRIMKTGIEIILMNSKEFSSLIIDTYMGLRLSHGNNFFPHIEVMIPQNKNVHQQVWHLYVDGSELYCYNTEGERNSVVSYALSSMDVTRLEQEISQFTHSEACSNHWRSRSTSTEFFKLLVRVVISDK